LCSAATGVNRDRRSRDVDAIADGKIGSFPSHTALEIDQGTLDRDKSLVCGAGGRTRTGTGVSSRGILTSWQSHSGLRRTRSFGFGGQALKDDDQLLDDVIKATYDRRCLLMAAVSPAYSTRQLNGYRLHDDILRFDGLPTALATAFNLGKVIVAV
jgi:hypothetical protein